MKLSKKIKYLLFSSIGIISIGTAAIATPLIMLNQNVNTVSNASSNQVDTTTANKLASFSTKWNVKNKEQQDIENQFNQYLNYNGNNESNVTKDVTMLAVNGSSLKNKELMTTISKGLKKLSTSQQNQIKNGMLLMHNLTKNNPINEKNIDSIYGHFISQEKINQIKTQINSFKEKAANSKTLQQNNNNSVLVATNYSNWTPKQTSITLETASITIGIIAASTAAFSVLMWFCDWFGITTNFAIGAAIIAGIAGGLAAILGWASAGVQANYEHNFNDSFFSIIHLNASLTPLFSILWTVETNSGALSVSLGVWGWVFPLAFTIGGTLAWITGLIAMLKNINGQ